MNRPPEKTLLIGDIRLDLIHDGGIFRGIGEVSCKDVLLRSDAIPMFAKLRTPFGVEFVEQVLTSVDMEGSGAVLRTSAKAHQGPIMEWMLHECRPRVATRGWGETPEMIDEFAFSMHLLPVSRSFGPFSGTGFSYQYKYSCPRHPIYLITDSGSWEIGGAAAGNTIVMRGAERPCVTIQDRSQPFSTEWYLPRVVNPNIFQFKPLQTHLQGFTLTIGNTGALITWPTRVAHVRTLIQKARNAEHIEHWHEHCADLGDSLETSPVEVIWIEGDFRGTELANLYFHIAEHIYTELHSQVGLRRERVKTYGVMEEWDFPNIDDYVEKGMPKLLEAGVKSVFISNMFEHNMNTFGVKNMCCTLDYKIAETIGKENVKALCDQARNHGAEVQMWGNTAISDLAHKFAERNGPQQRIKFLPYEDSIMEALEDAEAPFVRNAFGAIEADHYSHEFAQLNLRDKTVRTYWHKRWKAAHDKVGLDGIFLDSSFNMSSDKFHWSYWPAGAQRGATIDQTDLHGMHRPAEEPKPQILSQYFAHLSLVAEMQAYGYHYSGEDTGVFGLHRSGPDVVNRMPCFFLWFDSYCRWNAPAVIKAGKDPDKVFFEGLAYRVMWMLFWNPGNDSLSWGEFNPDNSLDQPSEAQLKLLHIYNDVEGDMRERTVSDDGKIISYQYPGGLIIWSLEDRVMPLNKECLITDLIDHHEFNNSAVQAKAQHIYRVTFPAA